MIATYLNISFPISMISHIFNFDDIRCILASKCKKRKHYLTSKKKWFLLEIRYLVFSLLVFTCQDTPNIINHFIIFFCVTKIIALMLDGIIFNVCVKFRLNIFKKIMVRYGFFLKITLSMALYLVPKNYFH